MGRVAENRETEWKCGRCGYIQDYTETPPSVCPNCSYIHGQRNVYDVPEEVKIKIRR